MLDTLRSGSKSCTPSWRTRDRVARPLDSPTDRWAAAVACVAIARLDVPTVAVWAAAAGMSRRSVYRLCETVETSAKPSLNVGRLARSVLRSAPDRWRPERSLNADLRTVLGLLDKTGLRAYHDCVPPPMATVIDAAAWGLPVCLRDAVRHRLSALRVR